MADYSQFPFEMYTTDELATMLRQSVKCGDKDFTEAIREEIKRRKPELESPTTTLERSNDEQRHPRYCNSHLR